MNDFIKQDIIDELASAYGNIENTVEEMNKWNNPNNHLELAKDIIKSLRDTADEIDRILKRNQLYLIRP